MMEGQEWVVPIGDEHVWGWVIISHFISSPEMETVPDGVVPHAVWMEFTSITQRVIYTND
jgi:hypothetical protein